MICRLCNGNNLITINYLSSYNIKICKDCLLLQRNPLVGTHLESFEENRGYDWCVTNENEFNARVKNKEKKWKFFTNKINLKDSINVLDFGSGFGALLEYLKSFGIQAVGIEPSKLNSSISKNKGHNVLNCYLTSDTFLGKKYDVINISGLMQYIPNIREIFLILNKILKDDGYLFIEDKLYNWSVFNIIGNLKYELTAQYFSKSSLMNLLTETHFKSIYFKNVFGHFYIIANKSSQIEKLKGSFLKEKIHICFLPLIDHLLQFLKIFLDKIYSLVFK